MSLPHPVSTARATPSGTAPSSYPTTQSRYGVPPFPTQISSDCFALEPSPATEDRNPLFYFVSKLM